MQPLNTHTTHTQHNSTPKPALKVHLPHSDKTLVLSQDLSIGLGAVVWDCGVLLSLYIDEACVLGSMPDLRGRHVLDIGAGTGVVGLAAHACCAPLQTVMTDIPENMLLERENIAANGLAEGAAVATVWDWTESDEPPPPAVARVLDGVNDDAVDTEASRADGADGGGFGLITCSDTLYDDKVFPHLLRTLRWAVGGNSRHGRRLKRGRGQQGVVVSSDRVEANECGDNSEGGGDGGNGGDGEAKTCASDSVVGADDSLILFAYKMRHPDREKMFFEALAEEFDVRVDLAATERLAEGYARACAVAKAAEEAVEEVGGIQKGALEAVGAEGVVKIGAVGAVGAVAAAGGTGVLAETTVVAMAAHEEQVTESVPQSCSGAAEVLEGSGANIPRKKLVSHKGVYILQAKLRPGET